MGVKSTIRTWKEFINIKAKNWESLKSLLVKQIYVKRDKNNREMCLRVFILCLIFIKILFKYPEKQYKENIFFEHTVYMFLEVSTLGLFSEKCPDVFLSQGQL